MNVDDTESHMPNHNFISLLTFLLLFSFPFGSCRDVITYHRPVTDNGEDNLVSQGNIFELGFFTLNRTVDSRRYVGIWYHGYAEKTVVWIANRENPIAGSGLAAFGILEDSNLGITDQGHPSVQWWSSKHGHSRKISNMKAILKDSGNLILLGDGSLDILWQSFDHPTDTFLPGMLMEGDFNLTAWKGEDDPAPGGFVFQKDQDQYIIKNQSYRLWESGTYDWFQDIDQVSQEVYSMLSNATVNRSGDASLKSTDYKELSPISNDRRVRINSYGVVQYFKLDNLTHSWSVNWSKPTDQCDKVSLCGYFASCNAQSIVPCKCLPGFKPTNQENWDSGKYFGGCQRTDQDPDGSDFDYVQLKKMKFGKPSGNNKVAEESECQEQCNSTNCQAYFYVAASDQRRDKGRRDGCWTWSEADSLGHVQENVDDGKDLHLRVSLTKLRRSCQLCGTILIPYPLSTTESNCGDPMYRAFICDPSTGQLHFQVPGSSDSYQVANIEAQAFTIQVENTDCELAKKILGHSSPFHYRNCNVIPKISTFGTLSGNEWLKIDIEWEPVREPLCNSPEDCHDWPSTECRPVEHDGDERCLCKSNLTWNPQNLNCTNGGGSLEGGTPGGTSSRNNTLLYLIFLVAVPAMIIISVSLYCVRKNVSRQRERRPDDKELQLYDTETRVKEWISSGHFEEEDKKGIDVPFFELEVLLEATSNFSKENKLGQGGFGPVYKGKFPGGLEIAVKRLLTSGSGQGLEEFKNEVMLIAKLQHRNLVKLIGYYAFKDEKMLVYEFMPNNSLDSYIFDRTKALLLTWDMRMEIILGIARGMLYLHQDSRLRIIHRDLKASNVLLDEEMNPKISDFGLARIFDSKQTEASTQRIIGTYGYMSPEYALDGFFSFKSDVFSFGVVVLEIISGKRNTASYRPEKQLNLLGHVWRLWNEDAAINLVDHILNESINREEVLKCINVALLCIQEDPKDRPTMSNVVFMLGSETSTLPTPKEPAFALRGSLSSTASSSSTKPVTMFAMTDTLEQGR